MASVKAIGSALVDDPARSERLAKTEIEAGREPAGGIEKDDPRHIQRDDGNSMLIEEEALRSWGVAPASLSSTGLTYSQRRHARDLIVVAAKAGLAHKTALHYTKSSPQRWEAITNKRDATKGDYPRYADCSSFYTWCAWNGLFLPYRCKDVVNNGSWLWGNTWSMIQNGARVYKLANTLRGDAVLYGSPSHTAVVVGWDTDPRDSKKKPFVISNGSEGGPYYLPYDYRSDIHSIRRYVLP